MSMISLTFMISSGIAGASTILVSHEFGRGNIGKMRRYAHASLRLAVIFMAGAAVIYAFSGPPSRPFSPLIPTVIKVARNLFFVVALFEIFDGLQVTALRSLTRYHRCATSHDLCPRILSICRRTASIYCRHLARLRGLRTTLRILWRPHVCCHPLHS